MRVFALLSLLLVAAAADAGWQRQRVLNPDGTWGPWGGWELVGPGDGVPLVILPPKTAAPEPQPDKVFAPRVYALSTPLAAIPAALPAAYPVAPYVVHPPARAMPADCPPSGQP